VETGVGSVELRLSGDMGCFGGKRLLKDPRETTLETKKCPSVHYGGYQWRVARGPGDRLRWEQQYPIPGYELKPTSRTPCNRIKKEG